MLISMQCNDCYLLIQSLRVLFLLFRLKKFPVLGKAELLQEGIFFPHPSSGK